MTITQALLTTTLMATALSAKDLTVNLADGKGQPIGTARISEKKIGDNKGGGVSIKLNVKNLAPGEHALHFHGTAKCEGPGFTTAGGHFNPAMKQHGKDNPMGAHAGDMANFTVGAKGTAKVTIVNPAVTLGDGPNSLFLNGGTAMMIHAKADDYKTDPAGNAGDRIACGVVTK
jgi:Cu-Zn family superoxide dismutase